MNENLAVAASINSIRYASEGNKEKWLNLYADDAVVRDPVGVSALDPAGEGHQGKAAIEAFWDMVIGPANITMSSHNRVVSGPRHCASNQQVVNNLADGRQTVVEMVATYEVNDEGKILAMSAYWDMDVLMSQMA